MIRMLDLFSGIGGFSLAATWAFGNELEIVSFCEIDEFCQKVLKKNFPDVPIHDDIKTLQGGRFGTIDIITGGFPCQSFSKAGKRLGKKDDRYLWPEMFRVIKETMPNWIIGENVTGIINMALDEVLSDLESEGYEIQSFIIPACAVNAPHQRDRVFIVANANDIRFKSSTQKQSSMATTKKLSKNHKTQNSSPRNTNRTNVHINNCSCGKCDWLYSSESKDWWNAEPGFCRMDDGFPDWVDRLKSLGNAIVPQVAHEIFNAIKEIEKGY